MVKPRVVSGITAVERKRVAGWIKLAFYRYAALRCQPSASMTWEEAERTETLIRRYGREFARIVLEGDLEVEFGCEVDLLPLWEDLLKLRARNFPPLDIADLSIACTAGATTLQEFLWFVGVTGDDLDKVKLEAVHIAQIISRLRKASPLGGSSLLFPIPLGLPEDTRDQVRRVEALPELLMLLALAFDNYPHRDLSREDMELVNNRPFALFRMLLKRFGIGYRTMSGLLITMRQVRQRVLPSPNYPRKIQRTRVKRSPLSRSKKGDEFNDSLRISALQRRLDRFFRHSPTMRDVMRDAVNRYLSDDFVAERNRGATLLFLFGQIWLSKSENA